MATHNIHLLGSPFMAPEFLFLGDQALGLNNRGVAVGVAHIPQMHAVQWNLGPVLLPTIGNMSVAYGINDSGHIVGGWGQNVWPGQGFLYRGGVMQNLASVFDADESRAEDINNIVN